MTNHLTTPCQYANLKHIIGPDNRTRAGRGEDSLRRSRNFDESGADEGEIEMQRGRRKKRGLLGREIDRGSGIDRRRKYGVFGHDDQIMGRTNMRRHEKQEKQKDTSQREMREERRRRKRRKK